MKHTVLLFLLACGPATAVSNGNAQQQATALDGPCALLNDVTLSNAGVTDASGDGLLMPGEAATVQVSIDNASTSFLDNPFLTFDSDTDGVTFEQQTHLFGIAGGSKMALTFRAFLSNQIAPGSTIHVQVGVLDNGQACASAQRLDLVLNVAAACVAQTTQPTQTGCAALVDVSVSDFHVSGTVAPGATVQLTVSLNELNGTGASDAPGVLFTSSDPGVTFDTNPWLSAVLYACQSRVILVNATLPTTLLDGAQVTFDAIVTSAQTANTDCDDATVLPLVVQVGQ